MTMIEPRTRRRVASQHCAFTKCWCASTYIRVTAKATLHSFKLQDDQGREWVVGEDLIETHTELANPTRHERLSGVDT